MKNIKIKFCLETNSQSSETKLYVCGNHPQLGNWDTKESLQLQFSKNQWVSKEPILVNSDTTLEYKFVSIKSSLNTTVNWENCENHKFKPEIYTDQILLIIQKWNIPDSAFKEVKVIQSEDHFQQILSKQSEQFTKQLSKKNQDANSKDKGKDNKSQNSQKNVKDLSETKNKSNILRTLLLIFLPILIATYIYYQIKLPELQPTVQKKSQQLGLWQLVQGYDLKQPISSLEIYNRDKVMIAINNTVRLYSIPTNKFNTHPLSYLDAPITKTIYLSKAKAIIAGSCDSPLIVWYLGRNALQDGLLTEQEHLGCVSSLVQDQNYFYSASSHDNRIIKWRKSDFSVKQVFTLTGSIQYLTVDEKYQKVIILTEESIVRICDVEQLYACDDLNVQLNQPQFIAMQKYSNPQTIRIQFYDIDQGQLQKHNISSNEDEQYQITNINFQMNKEVRVTSFFYEPKYPSLLVVGTSNGEIIEYNEEKSKQNLIYKFKMQLPVTSISYNGKYLIAQSGETNFCILSQNELQ